MDAQKPIGIFDSGMGGISVLREAHALLPHEDFYYFGDNGNAPYGTKSEAEIRALSCAAVERLLAHGIKALVIACNTATGAAAQMLRESLAIPVIGIEPALKPAAGARRGGKVLVMATPMTLSMPKFQTLLARYREGVVPIPCPGLMEFVERLELSGPALEAWLTHLLRDHLGTQVDAVVLGCTHYVFLRDRVASFFPETTRIMDGNTGTANQLRRVLAECGQLRSAGEGQITLETSGDAEAVLPRMRALLNAGRL